jgi:hypothetical protein
MALILLILLLAILPAILLGDLASPCTLCGGSRRSSLSYGWSASSSVPAKDAAGTGGDPVTREGPR